MEDDGLFLPEIASHSLEKIRRHNYYAGIFAAAMRTSWRHRVYIGLYSGAGRARLKDSNRVVETSALAVIRQSVPFTKYIFVDSDKRCVDALRIRVDALEHVPDYSLIHSPVNDAVLAIRHAMPRFTRAKGDGLIALCFVDPFRIDLDFNVVRDLSRYRIDFLIMLPLGFDLRRNLRRYLADHRDDRVARLIDAPDWREEWRNLGQSDRYFPRFALRKFDEAMQRLGFREREWKDTLSIKVAGMGVYLYSVALYSRSELAEKFWRTTLRGTDEQLGLDV